MIKFLKITKKNNKDREKKLQHYQGHSQSLAILFDTFQSSLKLKTLQM